MCEGEDEERVSVEARHDGSQARSRRFEFTLLRDVLLPQRAPFQSYNSASPASAADVFESFQGEFA